MTPAARLRRIAIELAALAAELDGARPVRAPREEKPDRLVNTAQAAKISKRSYSSLYRDARTHGFGWQLPTRTWQFSERALRAFLAQEKSSFGELGELGEVGDVTPLPLVKRCADVRLRKGLTT